MKDLKDARIELNSIDDELKTLFIKRMNIIKEIGLYKKDNNLPVYDAAREEEMIKRLSLDLTDLKPYYINLLKTILDESKKYQESIINNK